jgi:prepilin-type N-terminal cleavage/methylation domain-containing protein
MNTHRRGASLIELLVCLAIIGTLISLFLPAVQKVRATANVSVCLNNMRQLALGVQMYHDTHRHLPYPRLCPAPWQGGKDPFCTRITSPAQFTGPNELWWCPYDNRPGATVASALSDYKPAGMITPFLENNLKAFRCPDAADRTPGSPTQGRSFQVSYALVPQLGGRTLAEYVGAVLVEHDDVPVCPGPGFHHTEWPADAAAKAARHRPTRHLGALSIARHDGSVSVSR